MLGKVSQQVLDAVYSRLSASNGYNAGVAAQAPLYSLALAPMQLDFSASSQNFYFDQIDSEMLEKSVAVKPNKSVKFVFSIFFWRGGRVARRRWIANSHTLVRIQSAPRDETVTNS